MKYYTKYFEMVFWIVALGSLAAMEPTTNTHYSFCIFKLAGLPFCPGCGLGHSISYLFHGNIKASLSSHPLGIFAVVVILFRITKLLHLHFFQKAIKIKYGI